MPFIGLAQTQTAAGELGTGDVQVTLRWGTLDDLDLWVTDPEGIRIYYGNPTSPSGGKLDVDANAGCRGDISSRPVENIYWPTGRAPTGDFVIEVNYYARCVSDVPVSFSVRLLVDGKESEYEGMLSDENERYYVTRFER